MKEKVLRYTKYSLIVLAVVSFITPLVMAQTMGTAVDGIYSNIFKTICVGLLIIATILEIVEYKLKDKNASILPKIAIIVAFFVLIVVFWI